MFQRRYHVAIHFPGRLLLSVVYCMLQFDCCTANSTITSAVLQRKTLVQPYEGLGYGTGLEIGARARSAPQAEGEVRPPRGPPEPPRRAAGGRFFVFLDVYESFGLFFFGARVSKTQVRLETVSYTHLTLPTTPYV